MQNSNKTQKLFNHIADKYDFLNNIISFGTHKFVKRRAVKQLSLFENAKVLDICTGTGDLAGEIQRVCPTAKISAVDFSDKMLEIARKKVKNVNFISAKAENLPFDNNEFDIITIGFGLRNIQNREKALGEIYRVLKPNGEFMHLDFGCGLKLPDAIFNTLTPILAKIFFKEKMPYQYLINSKKEFPPPNTLIKLFENTGFRYKGRKDYIFGIISVQIMSK